MNDLFNFRWVLAMDNIGGTSNNLAKLCQVSDICSISLYIASLDSVLEQQLNLRPVFNMQGVSTMCMKCKRVLVAPESIASLRLHAAISSALC